MAVVLGAMVGCYDASPGDGQLLCSTDGRCPSGFHCAGDSTCWRDGREPAIDLMRLSRPPPDLAGAGDGR